MAGRRGRPGARASAAWPLARRRGGPARISAIEGAGSVAAAAGAVVLAAMVSTPLVAVLAGVLAGLAGRAWNRRRDDRVR